MFGGKAAMPKTFGLLAVWDIFLTEHMKLFE
jgi:hypothetical protein